jgi:histidinol phosphatase-like PHP family hydrolase
MLIDFHTHGKLAKHLPFSAKYMRWLFAEARHSGLDALCLTEHFNTLGFEELYRYIAETFPKEGDSFLCDGLRVFPGMEVDIHEGGHTLLVGTMADILSLHTRLLPCMEKGGFLPFKDLLSLVEEYPVIFGAAHPFRAGSNIPALPPDLLVRFHFLDLNGKDIIEGCDTAKSQVCSLASVLGLPVVAGSDTHHPFQYGSICNNFQKECVTVNALGDTLREGSYACRISPHAAFQVKAAGLLKRALKEIYALSGDYVSVLLKD